MVNLVGLAELVAYNTSIVDVSPSHSFFSDADPALDHLVPSLLTPFPGAREARLTTASAFTFPEPKLGPHRDETLVMMQSANRSPIVHDHNCYDASARQPRNRARSCPPAQVSRSMQVRDNLLRILSQVPNAELPPLIIHVRDTTDVGGPDEPDLSRWQLVFAPKPTEPVVSKAGTRSPARASRVSRSWIADGLFDMHDLQHLHPGRGIMPAHRIKAIQPELDTIDYQHSIRR